VEFPEGKLLEKRLLFRLTRITYILFFSMLIYLNYPSHVSNYLKSIIHKPHPFNRILFQYPPIIYPNASLITI